MLIPFKGRTIDECRPLQVYRNLNGTAHKVWSVRQNGLVVAHGYNFSIKDVTAHMSIAGQNRVKKTKTKNVHAYLAGILDRKDSGLLFKGDWIMYNPYKHRGFRFKNKSGGFLSGNTVLFTMYGAKAEC